MALVAGLLGAGSAAAHEPGAPTNTGFVASVASIEPNVLGLQAQIVLADTLVVTNRTAKPVVIFDLAGAPWHFIRSGTSQAWHDPRIVVTGAPPEPAAGAADDAPRFVRNWRVSGRADGKRFAIRGFVGYVPPPKASDGGNDTPWLAIAAGIGLGVLLAGAGYLVVTRRPRRTGG